MIRIFLGALAALAIAAMVGALALLAQPDVVEAQSHSASRAFQRTWAAPGGELRVTITARNYGTFGQVVETLPDGFTFKSARRSRTTSLSKRRKSFASTCLATPASATW